MATREEIIQAKLKMIRQAAEEARALDGEPDEGKRAVPDKAAGAMKANNSEEEA